MPNKLFKKGLVVGIIILFVGLAFIPSFNAVSNSNEVHVCNSESPPIANFTIHENNCAGYVLLDGTSSYDIDGEIILYEWEYGDGNTFNCTYGWGFNQYCEIGYYNVTLNVIDNDGLTGNLTKCIFIILCNCGPPDAGIYGPNSGNAGIEYEYTFQVMDPHNAIYFLFVDWGDGNTTGWIGGISPFEPISLTHIWSKEGKYTIRARAKDYCRIGWWTEFEVTMPRDKAITYSLLLRCIERYPLLNRLLLLIK